jgi:hypothetical protein
MSELISDDEGPWASERYPLTPHRLAKFLAPYEISSRQMRIGERNVKGFERAWFLGTWERFLPGPSTPEKPQHRNTEHARRFDVADRVPPEGAAIRDWMEATVEDDYPQSAWDPDYLDPPSGSTTA